MVCWLIIPCVECCCGWSETTVPVQTTAMIVRWTVADWSYLVVVSGVRQLCLYRLLRWSCGGLLLIDHTLLLWLEWDNCACTDYSDDRAVDCVNNDLVNSLCNLVSRCVAKSLNPRQLFPEFDPSTFDRIALDSEKHLMSNLYQLACTSSH